MNLICLAVDRLQSHYLACFGAGGAATPALDVLAAESWCFDQALADRLDLAGLYESYWCGAQAVGGRVLADAQSLPVAASRLGYETALIADDSQIGEHRLFERFDHCVRVQPPSPTMLASDESQSVLIDVFQATKALLGELREPFFLWIHARAMAGPWDAPYSWRERYADEEDPPPPDFVEPPWSRARDADLDWLLGIRQAYAAQVSLFDWCFGSWLDELRESPLWDRTALALWGIRGFPLGLHGETGVAPGLRESLFNQAIHVPFVLRAPPLAAFGPEPGSPVRTQTLAAPCDLQATFLELLQRGASQQAEPSPRPEFVGAGLSLLPAIEDDPRRVRDRIALVGDDGEVAFRTPLWYWRQPPQAAEGSELPSELPPAELYAKPDDWHEVNDIADRARDVAEAMQAAHAAYCEAAAAGAPTNTPASPPPELADPLPEILIEERR